MDIRVAITNDLLGQAERCFNDRELTFAYLEHIAQNTTNKVEMLRQLELIHKRIVELERNAKEALAQATAIEKEAINEQWYSYKRDDPFAPSEFYDFFSDERNYTELSMYYQKECPVTRIEKSVRQLEGLKNKSAELIRQAKDIYKIKVTPVNKPLEVSVKKKPPLQLDRGISKTNFERF